MNAALEEDFVLKNCVRVEVVLAAVVLALVGGCGPTEVERAHQKGRETEAEQRETLRRALEGGTEEGTAIKLVQSAPAPQGGGMY